MSTGSVEAVDVQTLVERSVEVVRGGQRPPPRPLLLSPAMFLSLPRELGAA